MDICFITNYQNSSWMYETGKSVMLLTHLVEKYDEYVKEALSHEDTYKILDNSLIELNGALSMERLIAAADKIKADEIIIPDVFRDGKATYEEAVKSIEWLKQNNRLGDFKIMAVAHGKTKEEFTECFMKLNNLKEIDVIGIPKVMSSFDWVANRSRGSLYDIFKDTTKEIHFLGSWYQLGELLDLSDEVKSKVRSCDTCLGLLDCVQNKGFYEDRDGTISLEKEYPEVSYNKYKEFIDKFYQSFYKKRGQ